MEKVDPYCCCRDYADAETVVDDGENYDEGIGGYVMSDFS
jgi:hypothetical protein